jgi:hypothetical protein
VLHDPRGKLLAGIVRGCHDIRRKIEDELGAQPYEHIHAIPSFPEVQ